MFDSGEVTVKKLICEEKINDYRQKEIRILRSITTNNFMQHVLGGKEKGAFRMKEYRVTISRYRFVRNSWCLINPGFQLFSLILHCITVVHI